MIQKTFISNSPEETQHFASTFSKKLKLGDILATYGELGAGKTTFIQGLAKGLGYTGKVFSPTFIFVRPYKLTGGAVKTLYHIDLYRIEKPTDVRSIGLEDFLHDNESISIIEWPERVAGDLPEKTKKLFINKISENSREFKWNE